MPRWQFSRTGSSSTRSLTLRQPMPSSLIFGIAVFTSDIGRSNTNVGPGTTVPPRPVTMFARVFGSVVTGVHRCCSPYSPLAIISALRIFCLAYSSGEMLENLAASTSAGDKVTLPLDCRLPDEFGTSRLGGALTFTLDGRGGGSGARLCAARAYISPAICVAASAGCFRAASCNSMKLKYSGDVSTSPAFNAAWWKAPSAAMFSLAPAVDANQC